MKKKAYKILLSIFEYILIGTLTDCLFSATDLLLPRAELLLLEYWYILGGFLGDIMGGGWGAGGRV